jgi:hypothetical protein
MAYLTIACVNTSVELSWRCMSASLPGRKGAALGRGPRKPILEVSVVEIEKLAALVAGATIAVQRLAENGRSQGAAHDDHDWEHQQGDGDDDSSGHGGQASARHSRCRKQVEA